MFSKRSLQTALWDAKGAKMGKAGALPAQEVEKSNSQRTMRNNFVPHQTQKSDPTLALIIGFGADRARFELLIQKVSFPEPPFPNL